MKGVLGSSGNTRNNTLIGICSAVTGFLVQLLGILPWVWYRDPRGVLRRAGRPSLELILLLLATTASNGMTWLGIPCIKRGVLNKASIKTLLSWFSAWVAVGMLTYSGLLCAGYVAASHGNKGVWNQVNTGPFITLVIIYVALYVAYLIRGRRDRRNGLSASA